MKICGVISEFNPFHNGHKYLLDTIRSYGYDAVICVMSGNFVQRGEYAILDKKIRAGIAVRNGADLVLSLPFPWSSATAEIFASGGISILDRLSCVNAVCFGSECGDISKLTLCAQHLLDTSVNDIKELQKVSPSMSYARARQEYILNNFGTDASQVLSSPNDILAVEYIKSILKSDSKIIPLPIKRNGSFHDTKVFSDTIASSSQIRELYRNNLWDESCKYLPECDIDFIRGQYRIIDDKLLFSLILGSVLSHTPQELANIAEIFGGYEYALYREALVSHNYEQLFNALMGKHLTCAKIRRSLLFAALWIEKKSLFSSPAFTEVLACNDVGKEILSQIRKTARIEILSKTGNIKHASSLAKEQFKLQRKAEMTFEKLLINYTV